MRKNLGLTCDVVDETNYLEVFEKIKQLYSKQDFEDWLDEVGRNISFYPVDVRKSWLLGYAACVLYWGNWGEDKGVCACSGNELDKLILNHFGYEFPKSPL